MDLQLRHVHYSSPYCTKCLNIINFGDFLGYIFEQTSLVYVCIPHTLMMGVAESGSQSWGFKGQHANLNENQILAALNSFLS